MSYHLVESLSLSNRRQDLTPKSAILTPVLTPTYGSLVARNSNHGYRRRRMTFVVDCHSYLTSGD